jgi:hypothetical protein
MMIREPKRRWREVRVKKHRLRIDFAQCMRTIVQACPDAPVIRVVPDHLT